MKKNYDFSRAVKNPYVNRARARTLPRTEKTSEPTSLSRYCIDLVKRSLEVIDYRYFRLRTTYKAGIIRERVFCYELYHQIRNNMESIHFLSLHGEIDKRGHVDFEPCDQRNPDFVFHVPGTHEGNTIVMEVKGTVERKRANEINQDLLTLLRFVEKYRYKAGLFFLYNHSVRELLETLGARIKNLACHPSASAVHILAIKEPTGPCEEVLLSELCNANNSNCIAKGLVP